MHACTDSRGHAHSASAHSVSAWVLPTRGNDSPQTLPLPEPCVLHVVCCSRDQAAVSFSRTLAALRSVCRTLSPCAFGMPLLTTASRRTEAPVDYSACTMHHVRVALAQNHCGAQTIGCNPSVVQQTSRFRTNRRAAKRRAVVVFCGPRLSTCRCSYHTQGP